MREKKENIIPFDKGKHKNTSKSLLNASKVDIKSTCGATIPPLTEQELNSEVRRLVRHGNLMQSSHLKEDRKYRNITHEDICQGLDLKSWTLKGSPEWDETHKNWKYTIKTHDIEGYELVLVVVLKVQPEGVFVTTGF